jgi:hypothetical protein
MAFHLGRPRMAQAVHLTPERASCRPRAVPPGRSAAQEPVALNPVALDPVSLDNVLELLRPGSFVRLLDQPSDLPPFQLIHCRGGRCWVRQQAWGPFVHWEVAHRRLSRLA